jgi:hypothetical protein
MGQSAFKTGMTAMDIYLNELSITRDVEDRYCASETMTKFAETAKGLFSKGIKKIKTDLSSHDIMVSSGYSLYEWIFDKKFGTINRNYRDFLLGMITRPFIPENKEDVWISADYFFQDDASGFPQTVCLGLASAFIARSLVISFQSNAIWKRSILTISIMRNRVTENQNVPNVYSPECLGIPEINCFIATGMLKEKGDNYLEKTLLLPDEKECHISDDHGKQELRAFWELLKNSPYVESARSAIFSSKGTHFIREIEPGGEAGIVNLSKNIPYTLRVKTTGKSYPETKRIAEILCEKYS